MWLLPPPRNQQAEFPFVIDMTEYVIVLVHIKSETDAPTLVTAFVGQRRVRFLVLGQCLPVYQTYYLTTARRVRLQCQFVLGSKSDDGQVVDQRHKFSAEIKPSAHLLKPRWLHHKGTTMGPQHKSPLGCWWRDCCGCAPTKSLWTHSEPGDSFITFMFASCL